jgi:hypothetical protein
MPWKSLRPNPNDGSMSKRHSTLFTTSHFRHSEQNARPQPPRSPLSRRQSDNGPRPHMEASGHSSPLIGGADDHGRSLNATNESTPDTTTLSSMGSTQPARRNRFSMLRFRHASDPQLSASYARSAQMTPSVPPLPPRKSSTYSHPFCQNLKICYCCMQKYLFAN